ncbi:hypothetical protein AK88_00754 [Plasmodium fragile]|uniref:PH domain-containing protein n=1 Tax=Plasmodium fragile TaxID=5857 RepID=A0A0D9QRG3_PLAFR|nr:uncharacterized protein AK88_00754 [Plasmodium fragile]KJP89543.1 hypothetical protein AK88_00754 [Plasmodium fragile]
MRVLSLLSAICLVCTCRGHRNLFARNNYLQYLRSQNFMQEKPKYQKLNQNYSEDLNEFDNYEDDEFDAENLEATSQQRDTHNSGTSSSSNENKLEFKNIDKELNNMGEILHDEKDNHLLMGGGRECSVSDKGILDVSLNSTDIFNLTKYAVEMSSSGILIKDTQNSNVVKEISFDTIKLPIETIEETRECWKIRSHTETLLFCERSKEDRDRWITNILKALFCYNTNNLTIDERVYTGLSSKVDIPKESTVDARIAASLKHEPNSTGDNSSNGRAKRKGNNNITISNLKNDKPQIVVN